MYYKRSEWCIHIFPNVPIGLWVEYLNRRLLLSAEVYKLKVSQQL